MVSIRTAIVSVRTDSLVARIVLEPKLATDSFVRLMCVVPFQIDHVPDHQFPFVLNGQPSFNQLYARMQIH